MFDRVVQLKPDDAEAHFDRGFLLQERRDHEGAMAAFRGRWRSIPTTIARCTEWRCRSSRPSPRRGLGAAQANTKLQPMSPYGWYQLARVQHELGRFDETQKVFDHLAKFEPKVARQLERETGLKSSTLG